MTDQDLSTMPAAALNSFAGGFRQPPPDSTKPRGGFGMDLRDGKGRCLMRNSWNAELYGPLKSASKPDIDTICAKTRVSGMWHEGTEFSKTLTHDGLKTLFFAGVNTNQCVLGTLLDCYYQGLDCIMLEDCCATKTAGGQHLAITDVSVRYLYQPR